MLTRSKLTGLLLSIVLCQFASPLAVQAVDSRPNFIVVLCDDLGYGDLECFGHPHIKTPNLNALAASGIRLTSCYSAAPVCSPSRVGLLTGRSPNRAGVYDWIPEGSAPQTDLRNLVHLRENEVTLPQLLKQAGYATCMAGKWHCNALFNSPEQPQPSQAGFDHWFGTQNNAGPSHVNPANYVRNGTKVGKLEGTSCQLATSEVIAWLESNEARPTAPPFFVYLAFHEPHEPVASPEELVKKYAVVAKNEDEAQFFANVENVDIAVGRLLAALGQLKIQDNTFIVFTADNGPETLDRYPRANRSYGRPGPLRGMKLWTTDAGFRVAGILSWPQKRFVNHESDQIVSSLDLLPTLCELAAIEPPQDRELDGTSLVPLLNGQTILREKPLLWCYYNSLNEQRVAMRVDRWKMLAKLNSGGLPKFENIYSGNREQVLSAELTDFELYDVEADISESTNLVTSAVEAAELKELMEQQYKTLLGNSYVWQNP